jgi:hypothetical protein
MKRLTSKKDQAKKQRRNQLIVGFILIGVMVVSTFGIIVNSFGKNGNTGENPVYNGQEFIRQGGYWYTQIGSRTFSFIYNPYEVQESFNITTEDLSYLSSYEGKPLYINSEDYKSEGEIARNFNGVPLRIQRACLNDSALGARNCSSELPIKDCSENIIIIREFPERKIYQEENCVFITGEKADLVKLADEYLFKITGIKD